MYNVLYVGGLGQISNFWWDEPKLAKFIRSSKSGSVEFFSMSLWVWIVQHVLSLCFRRIERARLKVV